MRVIAGSARSMPLKAPPGLDTRPTTDRIKETLFNMLQRDIPGAVFVDLFSGSGAIGIEALSRGAEKAYFVENSAVAIQCIQQNIAFTKFTECAIVMKQDCALALSSIPEKHVDIIFLDPPYGQELDRKVLTVLSAMPYVDEDTIVIAEEKLETDFSYVELLGFEIRKEKLYKTNKHVFLCRKAES